MGRIRTIKPEFPQSESVGRLSRDCRLLFVQLWTVADDYGRMRAAPSLLAGQLYPYDDDARELMPRWLSELADQGFIRLYEVDGSKYLDIPQWGKHQRIDNAGKSSIPEFREPAQSADGRGEEKNFAANRREPRLDLGPRTLDQDLGPRTNSRAAARETVEEVARLFEEFWTEYPQRAGGSPKAPALKSFAKALATGQKYEIDREAASAIVGGAKRFAADCRSRGKIGTEYVPHAATWLNQKRWQDWPEKSTSNVDALIASGKFHALAESPELAAWDRWSRRTRGRPLPRDREGGWLVDSQWPPEAEPPPVSNGENLRVA